MFKFLKELKYFDVPLLTATFLLLLSGFALLYSTSFAETGASLVFRQFVFAIAGISAFLFFAFFDYHRLAKTNKIFYVLLLLALTYLLLFGSDIRGGRRWIDFGIFLFQPAEFVKIVVILGLARLIYLRRGQINSRSILLWSLAYAGVPAALVMLEPDLGSALIILGIWAGLILISPIKKKILVSIILAFAIAAGLLWQFGLQDFQRNRVMVFLDPGIDPKGIGYNVKQAGIAIGSGQIFGRGLGKGFQGQHRFLPERQTDFIFASSAEEIGFVGSAVLLGLYLVIMVRILKVAGIAKDNLGMYICLGAFFLLFGHVIVNLGMNMGLLPVTGIPLPFLSAGGSSLIVNFSALGLVQNVAVQSKVLRF